jgi:protein-disulfide isomerase
VPRRLTQLAGIVLGAAAVSSGGGSSTPSVPARAPSLLGGLPQNGLTLGRAKAPVTLVEFNDMQCPICRDYTSAVFPTLVQRYVRTGKLKMEMRLQSFMGPDSVTAGRAVAAAARQNRAWMFADVFYDNQGQENSGYVTPDFVKSIAAAPTTAQTLKAGTADFDAHGLTGTPSFLIGRAGGPLRVLNWSALTPSQFTSQIDQLLA